MQKKLLNMVSVSSVMMLAGCDKVSEMVPGSSSKIECSDPDAAGLVIEAMQDAINTDAKNYDDIFEIPSKGSSIRASINQLKMDLTKIRTTKDDPQSSKNFCMGTLNVSIPTNMIQQANFTRKHYEDVDVEEDAYQRDLKMDANAVNFEAEYSVQPTDDGEVIFVELLNGDLLSDYLAAVVVDANQKVNVQKIKAIETKQVAQARNEVEQASQTAKAQASSEIAKIAAEQASVKAAMDYKRSEFNKMWGRASKEAQNSITSDQKDWVEWRDEVCVDEARSAEPARQEIVRMQCITRLLSDRYYEVKEYFDNYD